VKDLDVILLAALAGIGLSVVALAARWFASRTFWRGAAIMAASLGVFCGLLVPGDRSIALVGVVIAVLAITWVSGLDYLVTGLRKLRGRGALGGGDVVRMLGAVALPCLLVALLVDSAAPAWGVMAILALELSVGGLDNLLAHHRESAGALAWGLRVGGVCALLAAALAIDPEVSSLAWYYVVPALAVSLAGVTREFWRGRRHYLTPREPQRREVALPTGAPAHLGS
jgi:phosphatidylglycerophosphate synthase